MDNTGVTTDRARRRWRELSPAEVLAGNVVLDATEAAYVLGLTFRKGRCKGEPDSRRLLALVDAGHLAPINASMARPYWRFSASTVRRYIDGEVAA